MEKIVIKNSDRTITRIFDDENRLVEEQTKTAEEIARMIYEYDPDGDLYHIQTAVYKLRYFKEYELLPNGYYDTSRILERVKMEPTGEVFDQWFYWKEDEEEWRTEMAIHNEYGDNVRFVF